MSLGTAQREFAFHIACLIQHIYTQGHAVTFGDAYRSPKAHGGMGEQGPYGRARSAHKQRLAVDLNLFKDGQYLDDTASHEPFGAYWKALHPDNVWGGEFTNPDGNHYSRRYNGIS